jgi:hypothetical protein
MTRHPKETDMREPMALISDLFVLHQLGYDDLTLYEGSMGEWAKDLALPIETD